MLSLSQLFIYPIKSLSGIAIQSAKVTDRGLQYDRRFMLIDKNNRFLTQREFPKMALLQTVIEEESLFVFRKDSFENKLVLPLAPEPANEKIVVRIWNDDCEAQIISNQANDWFSGHLNVDCRLVYMPDATERKVDIKYAMRDDITNFSDGYPILVMGQASLDDLNSRLNEPLPVNRFRPNMVFTGGMPYEEDGMEHFSINGLDFYAVKPSARCVVTTTNQETGIAGKEPLKTLALYRSKNNKVYFGQNVLFNGEGKIQVGDPIHIIRQNKRSFLSH